MWQLTVSDEQLRIIAESLDIYSRIGMGQVDVITKHPDLFSRSNKKAFSFYQEKALFDNIKMQYFDLEPNQHLGIFSDKIDNSNRIAYDIYQVIRNKIAWDRKPIRGQKEKWLGVNFGEPFATAKEKLAELIKLQDKQNEL